jgi:hypothetical protein
MDERLMTALTKSEIGRAVTALRELTDIIERLEKATWPESQSDVLRKALAEPKADPSAAALALLADLTRQVDELTAADASRAANEAVRKTYTTRFDS